MVRRPGRAPIIRGDSADPVSRGKLCKKCSSAYNGVMIDSSARLSAPLRRVGAKGEGRFSPVSWDEALGEIAERLRTITAVHGGSSVLNTHYTGTFAMIGYHFPLRFFNRLGATEVDPDSVCNKAGHVALEYLYGTSLEGFDPRGAREANSILVWGANPSASAPHQHEHWLPEAPGTVIVVDPLRTETAQRGRSAPATSTGHRRRPRLRAHARAVARRAHGRGVHRCPHGRIRGGAARRSRVARRNGPRRRRASPGARSNEAAHTYGQGPSLLWIGQGLQRQPMGGNVVRSVALLPALTGNLARPGGGFLYLNGIETRGLDGDYLSGRQLAGDDPPVISQMDLAAAPRGHLRRRRALFCWNINIAASSPEQERLREALAPRRPVDRGRRPVPDRHRRLRRFRAPGVELPRARRPRRLVLPPQPASSGRGRWTRRAKRSRTRRSSAGSPAPWAIRARAVRARRRDPGEAARAVRDGPRFRRTRAQRHRLAECRRPACSSPTSSSRPRAGGSRSPRERPSADGLPRVPLALADPPPQPGKLRLLSPATAWTLNDSYGNDPIDPDSGSGRCRSLSTRSMRLTASLGPGELAPDRRARPASSCCRSR